MLERPALLLLPWTTARADALLARYLPAAEGAQAARARRILGPDGVTLGAALQHGLTTWWGCWFRSKRLQVFESDDASLVLSACRPSGPWRRWQVCDAEENPVGAWHAPTLYSPLGPPFAQRHGDEFRTLTGELMATCASTPRGCEVRFAEAPEAHPFARMVILAAVLAVRA